MVGVRGGGGGTNEDFVSPGFQSVPTEQSSTLRLCKGRFLDLGVRKFRDIKSLEEALVSNNLHAALFTVRSS
jgi:hypothetical protein